MIQSKGGDCRAVSVIAVEALESGLPEAFGNPARTAKEIERLQARDSDRLFQGMSSQRDPSRPRFLLLESTKSKRKRQIANDIQVDKGAEIPEKIGAFIHQRLTNPPFKHPRFPCAQNVKLQKSLFIKKRVSLTKHKNLTTLKPGIKPIAAGLPATPTLNGTSNLGTRP